jgi:hypothetical protein
MFCPLSLTDYSGADKTGPGVPGGVDSEYGPDGLSGKLGRIIKKVTLLQLIALQ